MRLLILISLLLVGCDTVDIKERVIHGEDNSSVQHAKVRQWNDTFKGGTLTDSNGEWTMTVPADVVINLCIENPRDNDKEACYELDSLITPSVESGSHEMIRI